MPAGVPVGDAGDRPSRARSNAALLAAAMLALATRPSPTGSRRWRAEQTAAVAETPPEDARADIRAAFPLPPNATIGIVGGGQLGRMSAMAAARLGYRCHIFTREADSPAGAGLRTRRRSATTPTRCAARFAAAVDVITFEFENVSAEGLELLAALKPVRPSPGILRISQDRVAEKSFVERRRRRDRPVARRCDTWKICGPRSRTRAAGGAENHAPGL